MKTMLVLAQDQFEGVPGIKSIESRVHPANPNGVQVVVHLVDGTFVSIIRTPTSYGGASGLLEACHVDERLPFDERHFEGPTGWLDVSEALAYVKKHAAVAAAAREIESAHLRIEKG